MAYALALKRAAASSLLNKLLMPIRSVAATSLTRPFSTDTQMTTYDDDDRDLDVDRHRDTSVSSRRRDDFYSRE